MNYFKHNIPFSPDREFGAVVHTLSKMHNFPSPCYMKLNIYGEIEVFAGDGNKILNWTYTYNHFDPEPPTERKMLESFFSALDKAMGEAATQRDLASGKLEVCL